MSERPSLAAGLLLACLATGPDIVRAHDFSQSESTVEFDGATVRVRLGVNLLELPGVDANGDQRVSYEELDRSIERVFAAIKEHFTLRAPAPPVRVTAARYEIVDEHVLRMDLVHIFTTSVGRLEIASRFDRLFGPAHRHLITARLGGELRRAVLEAGHPAVTFENARVTSERILIVVLAVLSVLALAAYRLRARNARAAEVSANDRSRIT